MIDALISSKTRIKLLLKFFLNHQTSSYLRNLESEFGESTNSIRLELNKFEKAGMLETSLKGNKKMFRANTSHPLFKDINNIIYKYVGLDQIVEYVVNRLGNLEKVYLTGSFSKGINSEIIDLAFVGSIDKKFLIELCEKVEKKINRKIRYLILEAEGFNVDILKNNMEFPLLIWSRETNKKSGKKKSVR